MSSVQRQQQQQQTTDYGSINKSISETTVIQPIPQLIIKTMHPYHQHSLSHDTMQRQHTTTTRSKSTAVQRLTLKVRSWCTRAHALRIILVLLLLATLITILILTFPHFVAHYIQLLQLLQPNLHTALIFFALIVFILNPLTPGYTLLLLGCGWLFSWYGFLIVYTASIVGSSFWFLAARHLQKHLRYQMLMSQLRSRLCPVLHENQWMMDQLRLITIAVEQSQWRISTLLQLAFLPYNLLNWCLATQTQLEFRYFLISCCLSRCKLMTYIWLAVSSRSLSEVLQHRNFGTNWRELLLIGLSVVAALTAAVCIGLAAKRRIGRVEKELEEMEEQGFIQYDGSEVRRNGVSDLNSISIHNPSSLTLHPSSPSRFSMSPPFVTVDTTHNKHQDNDNQPLTDSSAQQSDQETEQIPIQQHQ